MSKATKEKWAGPPLGRLLGHDQTKEAKNEARRLVGEVMKEVRKQREAKQNKEVSKKAS